MRPHIAIGLVIAWAVLAGGQGVGGSGSGQLLAADQPPPIPGQEQAGAEVLTRGPVHEAFAEPVPLQTQAGLTVPKAPPANIAEVPPADVPQGGNFVWIPGYWGWDSDRSDYIWVSGCWRAAPPGMTWVPGYWAEVTDVEEARRGGVNVGLGALQVHVGGGVNIHVGGGDGLYVNRDHPAVVQVAGWEWVPGFWAPAGSQEIEYLPAPPAPVDLAAPGPPPAVDDTWVPGCWYWQDGRYVQRAGYWLQQRPDWVWLPSHYRWTPRGYVFAAGHWDFCLERRGVLFAPVYLPQSVCSQVGFSYCPSIAIDLGLLTANLFAYPRYNHYCFGDYYDDAYLTLGIYPGFECDSRHTWYDPIYTYDRWHYGRADRQWEEHHRQAYDRLRADRDLRPARTYREMEARLAKLPEAQRRNYELASPIQAIAARKGSSLKLERLNADTREKMSAQAAEAHKFRDERVKWEAAGQANPKASVRPGEHVAGPTAEHQGPVTPGAEHTPELVAPRQVPLTAPERVKIPAHSMIEGRHETAVGESEKGTPPQPTEELKHKADAKSTHKDEGEHKGK